MLWMYPGIYPGTGCTPESTRVLDVPGYLLGYLPGYGQHIQAWYPGTPDSQSST